MNVQLCTSYKDEPYKFLWLTEDSKGVYTAGLFGHFSYHSDGTEHFKNTSGKKLNEFKKSPLSEITGCRQVRFQGFFINDSSVRWAMESYKKPSVTDLTIFLNEDTFHHNKQIGIDIYIMDQNGEKDFVNKLSRSRMEGFHLINSFVFKLDNFEGMRLGLKFFSVEGPEQISGAKSA